MDPFQSAFVIAAPNMLPTSTSLCFNYVDAQYSLIGTAVHSIENRLFTLLLAAGKYQWCKNHCEPMKAKRWTNGFRWECPKSTCHRSLFLHTSLSQKKKKWCGIFCKRQPWACMILTSHCSKETKARIRYGYCKTYRRTTIYTYLHIIATKQNLFFLAFLHYPIQSQGF